MREEELQQIKDSTSIQESPAGIIYYRYDPPTIGVGGKTAAKAIWDLTIYVDQLQSQLTEARERLNDAVNTLRKIDEPHRYHHKEPDDYTQLACAQFQAHECLKRLGKYEIQEPNENN